MYCSKPLSLISRNEKLLILLAPINLSTKSIFIYIHNYNWSLQPFSQDFGIASHTTHVVCVNFIREWRDLQFNVISERHILRQFYLLSEFLPEIC